MAKQPSKARSTRRKKRRRRRRVTHVGAPPGVFQVDPHAPPSIIRAMCYDVDGVDEPAVANSSELIPLRGKRRVLWVNIDGLGNEAVLRGIGDTFGLHALTLEDIAHVHQRPKIERYDTYLYIVLRMPWTDPETADEQISIVLGEDFVLTFQERTGDCLDPVRGRIRQGHGRIRTHGPDYLAYALIDTIIDQYFPLLELIADRLEHLEAQIIEDADRMSMAEIHDLKKELRSLRRAVWPLRELMSQLTREGEGMIGNEIQVFIRDCYDHAVQLMELVEAARDATSSLMELHMSSVSNRMNEVMKVLTIIATIFIPLSFIAGVYGMNFETKGSRWNMPELSWRYGYFFSLLLMLSVAGGLLYYFRRKGWLGAPSRPAHANSHKPNERKPSDQARGGTAPS